MQRHKKSLKMSLNTWDNAIKIKENVYLMFKIGLTWKYIKSRITSDESVIVLELTTLTYMLLGELEYVVLSIKNRAVALWNVSVKSVETLGVLENVVIKLRI